MEETDKEKTLLGKQKETPSPNTARELTGELEIVLPAIKINAQADITPSPEEQAEQAEFDLWFDVAVIDSKIKQTESQIEHLFSRLDKSNDPDEIIKTKAAIENKQKRLTDFNQQRSSVLGQTDTEDQTSQPTVQPEAKQQIYENALIRRSDYWSIHFEGKESNPIKQVDGLLYIAYLLKRPGESIHSLDLYNAIKGIPDKIIDGKAAIDDGLNIGTKKQAINDSKTEKDIKKALQTLKNITLKSDGPEDEMIQREEIQTKIKILKRRLNERDFANDATKKQTLIRSLLKTACKNIKVDHNMKKCADYLDKQINTDGALGWIYKGVLKWKIFL